MTDRRRAQLGLIDPKNPDGGAIFDLPGVSGPLIGDGRGRLFGAVAGSERLYVVNVINGMFEGEYTIEGCSEITDIAIDAVERRLFVPCANNRLFVLDSDTGLTLSRLPTADGHASLALDFEPDRKVNILMAFDSGAITIGRVEKVTFYIANNISAEDSASARFSAVSASNSPGKAFASAGTRLFELHKSAAGE